MKIYSITPSLRQQKAVENWLENGGNASKAMRDAGYSPATAKNPQKFMRSKGFKQLFKDCGLSVNELIVALKEDLANKPGARLGELKLAMKLLGMLDAQNTREVNITFSKPVLEDKARLLDILNDDIVK